MSFVSPPQSSVHRAALVVALAAVALSPAACNCDPEELGNINCDFSVETSDLNDSVVFRETAVGDERNRSIRILNSGNVVLENFQFAFSERNGQHYLMGPEAEDLRVEPNGSETVRVFFKPLAESPNLGSALTVAHNRVQGVDCPAFAVTLEGSSFERIDLDGGPDAGDDAGDAGPDGGPDDDGGLVDAGVVTPPDGGVILPPGARFSARGALQEARSGFASLVLDDATVLAIGGYGENGQALTSIERFDPRLGKSRVVAHMSVARAEPGAALLDDGRVAIAGGRSRAVGGVLVTTVEIYDPADDSVTCPADQGSCSLQDIDQGRGVLPEGRIDPIVVAPTPGDPAIVVAFGRTLDENEAEVPAGGGFLVSLTGTIAASPLDGGDTVQARTGEARVIADDGSFLIAGGVNGFGMVLSDMAVFSAATRRIGPLSPLTTPLRARAGAAAALLADGNVIVAGGVNAFGGGVAEMERILDPFDADGSVDPDVETVAGISLDRRVGATLAALPGDLLLLAGGADREVDTLEASESVVPRSDAELFVPFADTFLRVAPDNDLAVPRYQHGAEVVTLPAEGDGGVAEDIVLFLGGTSTAPRRTPHPQAERFRVVRNEFEVYGLMGPGTAFAANAPADLYSVGGIDPHTGALSARVRAFDTVSDEFGDRPPLDEPRRDHALTLLADDNTFLVAGGRDATGQVLGTASLYNPFNAFDEPLPATLNRPRANPTATRLEDGTVLLCGGQGPGGEALDTCELFVPPSSLLDPGTYDEARFELVEGRLSTGRVGHTATLLEDEGEVLLVGGGDVESDLVRADLYSVADQRVTATGLPNRARRNHVAVYLGSGRVLIAGGEIYVGGLAPTDEAEVYERTNGVFLPLDDRMSRPRAGAGAVRLVGGDVVIYGGARPDDLAFPTRSLADSELYQPGPTGVGEFVQNIDVPLNYGRSDVAASEVFGRGVAAGGNHRDGRLGNGDERRTPLYFVDKLVNPGEEEPPPAPPAEDAGLSDGG